MNSLACNHDLRARSNMLSHTSFVGESEMVNESISESMFSSLAIFVLG